MEDGWFLGLHWKLPIQISSWNLGARECCWGMDWWSCPPDCVKGEPVHLHQCWWYLGSQWACWASTQTVGRVVSPGKVALTAKGGHSEEQCLKCCVLIWNRGKRDNFQSYFSKLCNSTNCNFQSKRDTRVYDVMLAHNKQHAQDVGLTALEPLKQVQVWADINV